MKPYFETKVVKVKKEKKEWTPDCCPCCGAKREAEEPKGNWVNGENLDKIKFPVPCSYVDDGKKHYGMLSKGIDDYGLNAYELFNIDKQSNMNRVWSICSLAELIEFYNIHILKGKIILFEEE